MPQVVQIEHMTAPYIEEDCDPSTQGGCQSISTYQANTHMHCSLLLAKGMTLAFAASVRLVARAAAHEEGMAGTSVDVI